MEWRFVSGWWKKEKKRQSIADKRRVSLMCAVMDHSEWCSWQVGSLHFNRGHLIHQTLFLALSLPLSVSFINRPALVHPLWIGGAIWTRCLVTKNSFWNYCLVAKLRWKARLQRTQTNTQVTLKDELGVFPISTLLTDSFMTLFEINTHYGM